MCISLQPKVQFLCIICMSKASRGSLEWPLALLTLLRCHPSSPPSPSWMVWSPSNRARVRGSWTRGYWEINRYTSDEPRSGSSPFPPPFLPTFSPPPCCGQMKTMQFSMFHTSLFKHMLLQDKKCLCLPRASDLSADVSMLSRSLHFNQCLEWEVEERKLIKYQSRILLLFFLSCLLARDGVEESKESVVQDRVHMYRVQLSICESNI